MHRRLFRAVRLVLPSGVLALAPAVASAHGAALASATWTATLAPADIGPPPSLPDLGPPPSLPPTGGDLSQGAAPPPSSPSSPSAPGTPPAVRPSAPKPGPPVMRPTIRTPPAAAPAPVAPTPPPPATITPMPEPPPPAASGPPPASTVSPVPTPPPGAAAPVPSASPPAADGKLLAPKIGDDPLAPADAEAKKKPEKDPEEAKEEEARKLRKQPKKWRHAGLILEPRIGLQGCTRQFCAGTDGHRSAPGVNLGGFVGGNVLGILDAGIEIGWGTLRPRDVAGKNAVSLYGLVPEELERAIAERMGIDFLALDLSSLLVTSAKTRTVNVGPALRVHFIRKGRGVAYVGAGIHYQQWRNSYETVGGPTRLTFHGLVAPLRVGGGAYVHPNIAITGEFAYHYAFFVVGGVAHTDLSAVVPLAVVEGAALEAGADLRKGMPHFWSFTVNLRFRLGV